MDELALLTCPVCGKHRLLPADRAVDREGLKTAARSHLSDHRLTESRRGIYGVMMAERVTTIEATGEADLTAEGRGGTDGWIAGASPGSGA